MRNHKCEGSKTFRLDNQQPSSCKGEGSTTIYVDSSESKRLASIDEDIVWTTLKDVAVCIKIASCTEIMKEYMREIWKNISDIKGFEDFTGYKVSNCGRLKSFRSDTKGRILKTTLRKGNGGVYEVISLRKGPTGPFRKFSIHRLVALAFLYNQNHESLTIDHINENPLDNRLENLQWLTAGDNIRKSQSGSKIFTDEEIGRISQEYLSNMDVRLDDLAKKYNCSLTTMWLTINRFAKIENHKRRRAFSVKERISIAERYLSGKTLKEVGAEFSCCCSQVSFIVKQYRRGELNELTGT